jgi:hypothetical protein
MSTTFDSVSELEQALRRAAEAHGKYEAEQLGGVRDEEWAAWYAEFIVNAHEERTKGSGT